MITSDKQISPSNLTFKQNSLHFFFALFILCMDILFNSKRHGNSFMQNSVALHYFKIRLSGAICLLTSGGGGGVGCHMGIFWVGMCRLELQIGTPF